MTKNPKPRPRIDRAERVDRTAKKPWHRSTIFVSLVSLVGALISVTVTKILSEYSTFDRHGDRAYGNLGGVGGDGFDLGPNDDKDAYDAADAFAHGNTEYTNGRLQAAKQRYLEAVRLAPSHTFAWANLGNVQRELREVDAAIVSHRYAVSLLPTRARHWYNLGVSLYSSRNALPDAVDAFQVRAKIPAHVRNI